MAPAAVVERRNRRKAKKTSKPIEMSDSVESSSGTATPEIVDEQDFENDLDYLLTNKEKVEGELVYTTIEENKSKEFIILDSYQDKAKNKKDQNGQLAPKRPKKFTVADITKDMEGLDFSSDDEVTPDSNEQKNSKKLNKKKSQRNINKLQSDPKNNSAKKSKSNGNLKPNIDTRDTKKDLVGILSKENFETSDVAKSPELNQHTTEKTKKPKKPRTKRKNKNTETNSQNEKDLRLMDVKDETTKDSTITEDPVDDDGTGAKEQNGETEEEILKRKLKNKKRKDRRKKRSALLKEAEAGTPENEDGDSSVNTTNTPSKETTPEIIPEVDNSNPFSIKLRSIKSTTNKKYSENLPEVQPIKTIIGMSHKQILHSDLSDVKIKTLMTSSSISKYAANAVKFVTTHAEDLFADSEKKKIFITLCINVALYESLGFKKTVKDYPNVLELFGDYDEINLEKTRTKLTPSKKDIHQNNLDYSVLSYFGHILIWAAHQQRQGKVPIFTEKFDIVLTNKEVRSKLGGYHLWDKLFRELKGMNSKRWKHVIKFRNAFPYEEDQFMIILRFMSIDDNIP